MVKVRARLGGAQPVFTERLIQLQPSQLVESPVQLRRAAEHNADVVQLAARQFPKLEVAGSNPVIRSPS
jgi:hypothetical protein